MALKETNQNELKLNFSTNRDNSKSASVMIR